MSLYFDNFGGSGRSAWTRTLPPPAQAGRAQPVQPQSQGTPYGQQPDRRALSAAPRAQDFAAYQPRPTQQAPANPFAQYNPQQMGNFVQQQMGLPSFQFTAADSFGNTYDNPAALTAQQGAMAQAMNAQRAQQIQSGNFGPLNPVAAYQQAQNMVQGGWTNPFAQQPAVPNGGDRPPSAFNPAYMGGQAQPVPPPSQGTPYGSLSQRLPQPNAGRPQPPMDPALQQSINYTLGLQETDGRGGLRPHWRATAMQDLLQDLGPNHPAFAQKARELNPATDTVAEIGGRAGAQRQAAGLGESPMSRANRQFARDEMYEQSRRQIIAAGRSPGALAPQPQSPPTQRAPSAMYVAGADLTTLPYTDTLQPNPLYRGGQAQPVPPPSQGTPYGGGYYNSAGDLFPGTMSFAPGTSADYQREAMQRWAASQGFYPQSPSPAQPVPPPSQGTPYGTPPDRRSGQRTNQYLAQASRPRPAGDIVPWAMGRPMSAPPGVYY